MEWITGVIIGITALISAGTTLIVTTIKAKKTIEETIPKKLSKQCSADSEIIHRMEQTKEVLKADRVQIYDFHNGGHYANGRSALKTSCTYEVTRASVRGYQMHLQSLPLSAIPRFTKKLIEQGEMFVYDLESIKDDMPSAYNIKKEQDVKAFYDMVLENEEGEPIGFLGIQYTSDDFHGCCGKPERHEMLKLKFFVEEKLREMTKKA